ncbi:MAG: uroporphyrinogen decarboxylase [Deltaproteobacteria bacterium]|nr:uroporphyrinogen decarboxylase [Deltaproteobacteria bacterium]
MQKLIEKLGGRAMVAPSLKEVPLADNAEALDFFAQLEAGKFDLVVLMTGVGLRTLLKVLEEKFPKERVAQAFGRAKVVVRGPKPTAVCKMNGIPIAVTVPPPNTWQEILQILTQEHLLQGKRVAVLEYGISNLPFLDELKSRGAEVCPVRVYAWALPDDTAPLRQAVDAILAGQVDVMLVTSAVQIDHLLKMVGGVREELALRRALQRVAVFSIGPTTSAHLRERQIFPDAEAFPNKLENLVELAAQSGAKIVEGKRRLTEENWVRIAVSEQKKIPVADSDAPMLRACRREKNDRIPIWLMRQAGRYMQEYQLVRQGVDFLTLCKTPDLAAQATLDAIERLGVDAAIIFSDILMIVEPMGLPLEFRESVGPLISAPIRSVEDIQSLRPVQPEESMGFVLEAIRKVRREMHSRIPLIGFAGAPFTIAAYMIEGKGSRNYIPTKTLMHEETKAWHELMEKITTATVSYLKAQVVAGCQILQLFDSWVGCLSPDDYRDFVLPHMRRLFSELPKNIPSVHFGTGTATLLSLQKAAGGDVIGLDWRQDIAKTWEGLGDVAIQGNLDPVILFSRPEVIRAEAKKILDAVGSKPGFIFNLGHGILPETPVDHVLDLVEYVHRWRPG